MTSPVFLWKKTAVIAMALGILFPAGAPQAAAGDFAGGCDLQKCRLLTPGEGNVENDCGNLRFSFAPSGREITLRVTFKEPLSLAGKDRLVIDARGEEWSGISLCVSRVILAGADGSKAVYEPDLGFPPDWNRRAVSLREFEGKLPNEVKTVEFGLYTEYPGKKINFWIKRFEFLSLEDVFSELKYPESPARPRLPVKKTELLPEHRRWVSIDPGGGGWYRTVAFSPHDGSCWLGGDVGGVYRTKDNGKTWEVLNCGLSNLYCNTVAFHPSEPLVVFAGTNGGVAKSVDGGLTWSLRRAGFPPQFSIGLSAPVSAVAVHPKYPEIVFAGIGHERGYGKLQPETAGGRVYRSSDGGESWHMTGLPGGPETRKLSVFCFVFHPSDPKKIFLSTQGGVFSSDDSGESWTALGQNSLAGYKTTFLTLKSDEPNVMLLGFSDGPDKRGGVLKSADGGDTWAPALNGLPNAKDAWRLVAHPKNPGVYYLGFHRGGHFGVYATHDTGLSWKMITEWEKLTSAWFFPGINATGLGVDPLNPDRLVFCNDMDIYQSLDGGKNWDQIATNLARPATPDSPAVWRGRNCPILCASGPQALAVDFSNPKSIILGYWDIHAWKSDDGGQTLFRLTDGTKDDYGGMGCAVFDPDNSDIVYMSVGQNTDRQRLYMSVKGGKDMHLIGHAGNGLPEGLIISLLIDPRSPGDMRALYAAVTERGVFKSSDGGRSWRGVNNGLPESNRAVNQIVMDSGDSKRLLLSSGAHSDAQKRIPGYIAGTLDGGENWEILKDKCEPQCVLVDPFDPQTIYAGNRNYSGIDYPNALYKSADGGKTWKSFHQRIFLNGPGAGPGLKDGPRIFVTCLAADPSERGRIYAACRQAWYDNSNGRGVFVSDDSGETWRPMPAEGLYNFNIGTLVVDPVDPSRIYAGTDGNGYFRFGPPPGK
jgi:photosystem II stability/assembly factor-like uncharacterized protein